MPATFLLLLSLFFPHFPQIFSVKGDITSSMMGRWWFTNIRSMRHDGKLGWAKAGYAFQELVHMSRRLELSIMKSWLSIEKI